MRVMVYGSVGSVLGVVGAVEDVGDVERELGRRRREEGVGAFEEEVNLEDGPAEERFGAGIVRVMLLVRWSGGGPEARKGSGGGSDSEGSMLGWVDRCRCWRGYVVRRQGRDEANPVL